MSFGRQSYSAVLLVLLIGILLAGSYALSMLVHGSPAYPVKMFGHATLSAELVDAQHIRGKPAELAEGRLPSIVKLPAPAAYDAAGGAAGASADDPARALLRSREMRLLDQARLFNQAEEWDRSLRLYDALLSAHPGVSALSLERAHVLTWAGRNEAAAAALLEIARARHDAAIAFEAAQNYWWAGRLLAADSALALVLAWQPAYPGAVALREQVRSLSSPDLATARAWAREGGLTEQLLYGRALVAAAQYADAITPYRRALALGAADSVQLELAAAASAADSTVVAVNAMRAYLSLHPDDVDTRLALARQYAWAEQYDAALHEYDRLVADGRSDLALERAQTLVWSGAAEAGAQALRVFLASDSLQPDAWRLLGDVERWSAHPERALAAYRTAARLQPGDPDLPLQIAAVEQEISLARRAGLPPSAANIRVEGMHDTDGFTYVQTRAEQFMSTDWGGFRLAALSTLPSRSFGGGTSTSSGYGGAANVVFRPLKGVQLDGGATVQHFTDIDTFLGWNAGATWQNAAGTSVHAGFVREPAVRRTGTMLSLQARTVSERIELLASGRLGQWGWSAQAERERLASDLGDTRRSAGAVGVNYAVTPNVSLDARVSALATSAASPALPGFGALYWAPERYLESTAGVSLRSTPRNGLSVGGTVAGGYALTRERPGPGARFNEPGLPIFAVSADITYQRGPWSVVFNAGYGGAVRRGYRSLNSALGISYALPR
jgi:tetratricopeptide (TPR) repeat protein